MALVRSVSEQRTQPAAQGQACTRLVRALRALGQNLEVKLERTGVDDGAIAFLVVRQPEEDVVAQREILHPGRLGHVRDGAADSNTAGRHDHLLQNCLQHAGLATAGGEQTGVRPNRWEDAESDVESVHPLVLLVGGGDLGSAGSSSAVHALSVNERACPRQERTCRPGQR